MRNVARESADLAFALADSDCVLTFNGVTDIRILASSASKERDVAPEYDRETIDRTATAAVSDFAVCGIPQPNSVVQLNGAQHYVVFTRTMPGGIAVRFGFRRVA